MLRIAVATRGSSAGFDDESATHGKAPVADTIVCLGEGYNTTITITRLAQCTPRQLRCGVIVDRLKLAPLGIAKDLFFAGWSRRFQR